MQAASRTCNELHRDFTVQFRVLRPDGTVHSTEDHGILDFDEAGELVSITGLSMDITARKEAEFALRAAKERASGPMRPRASPCHAPVTSSARRSCPSRWR